MLCEDNILNQRLAQNVIQKFGFELTIANNGQEGIDLLLKNKYDLILMDLQMPVKDGYQTTIYIRQQLKLDIPIVAMTAHSLIGEQQKCFDIGMNAYVAKPFKQHELLTKIQSVIEKRLEKKLILPVETEAIVIPRNTRTIDFSYLDELSEGEENDELRNEMIRLFINKVPEDLGFLEKAIQEKDFANTKKVSHDMKSSLSMFRLANEVAFLEKIENNATSSIINAEWMNEFVAFKNDLIEFIQLLNKS